MGEYIGVLLMKEVLELKLSLASSAILSMAISLPNDLRLSNMEIGKRLNISDKTVRRSIDNLRGKGLIKTEGNTSARVIISLYLPRTSVNLSREEDVHSGQYDLSTPVNMTDTSVNLSKTPVNMTDIYKDRNNRKINRKEIVKKKKPKTHPLYNPIKESFLSKNDGVFTDYKKEGMGIKGLIKKAETRNKDNPEVFIQGMIEQFYKMTNNGEKFWKDQPFLPSRLNSSGIFDTVLKKLQDIQPRELMEDDFEILKEVTF